MYKFELTEQEVQVISEALGNVPYKFVAGVVAKMQAQIAASEVANKAQPVDLETPA